jgi:hypothetical protein
MMLRIPESLVYAVTHTTRRKLCSKQSATLQNAINGLNNFDGGAEPSQDAPGVENAHSLGAGSSGLGFGVTDAFEEPKEHQIYERIGGKLLVGLYLSVWARKPVATHVSAWQVRPLSVRNELKMLEKC